jgi:hypothetical protein
MNLALLNSELGYSSGFDIQPIKNKKTKIN